MYFVTICTHNRINLFGEIGGVGNEWTSVGAGSKPALTEPALTVQMRLNEYGEIVQNTWNDLVHHISGIELGEFVVMPNHIHGIIIIVGAGSVGADSVRAGSKPAPHPTITQQPLSEIMRQFKTFLARRINEKRSTSGAPVWQRNYFEHIIRNQESYERIATYIANNPVQWKSDQLFSGELS